MMTTTVSSSSPVSEPEPDDTKSPGPNPTTLLHLSFNQDRTSFSAGTDSGFRVYSCDPFLLHSDPDYGPRGGVGLVQMHFRHSFAVVGGGPDPFCPVNVVKLWDDRASKCVAELQFRSEVKSVKFLRDRIVVVVKHKVFLYSILDLKLSSVITTIENPRGLCDVSYKSGQAVLACPGLHPGQVRVEHYGSQRTKFIMAHCSSLACLALTSDGRFLATASSKGTLVRVFNTLDCTLLQEVRRGTEKADIYSLAFSSTSQWLAVSSGKGTVHVFNLKVMSDSIENDRSSSTSGISISNPSGISSLYFIKAVLPSYFSSEWSVAQFRLQEGVKYVVTFGHQKNTVVIIGMDGSFYRCQFDPVNGGEMTQLEYHNFLKPE